MPFSSTTNQRTRAVMRLHHRHHRFGMFLRGRFSVSSRQHLQHSKQHLQRVSAMKTTSINNNGVLLSSSGGEENEVTVGDIFLWNDPHRSTEFIPLAVVNVRRQQPQHRDAKKRRGRGRGRQLVTLNGALNTVDDAAAPTTISRLVSWSPATRSCPLGWWVERGETVTSSLACYVHLPMTHAQ